MGDYRFIASPDCLSTHLPTEDIIDERRKDGDKW